jgi:hypothetical protein
MMDANEMRDAAERVIAWCNEEDPAKRPQEPYDMPIDAEFLAIAVLAEHDPTPLTADFIRQHTTLQDDGVREFEMELAVRLEEPIRESTWWCSGTLLQACLIPETVGELRQTAAKCGFSLKEP